MPCVLDSPFCSYDRYSIDEEDATKSHRESNSLASTSGSFPLQSARFCLGLLGGIMA